ncbi:MAG: SDR family oxidoreductase [Planctomycetaceae bacterium]|nr:SDR family oxidoreductase [Planctomycetaceae bacterium]
MNKKIALITGAAKRRIGNAVAVALADRGYAIALHYRRSADEARSTVERLERCGVQAAAFQADLAEPHQIDRLFDDVLNRFGRLDALVTTAALWERTPLEQLEADDLRRHLDVNTVGTFWCCRRAGLAMVQQPEGGAIVTIGDAAVARPGLNYSAYLASKGAIPAMTRALAVELAHRNPNVRVNCILPGPIQKPDDTSPHDLQGTVAVTTLKRLGRPENIAEAAVFLIENDFVTGVCLPVDGGMSLGPA